MWSASRRQLVNSHLVLLFTNSQGMPTVGHCLVEFYGQLAGKFSSGTGTDILDRSSAKRAATKSTYSGILRAGRLESHVAADNKCRAEIHIQFPSRSSTTFRARSPICKHSNSTTSARITFQSQLGSCTNSTSARVGVAYRVGDNTVVRAGYGVIWIEQAGITTPFTVPQFPFIQSVTQRTLDNINPAFVLGDWAERVAPIPLTPDAGLGQGCVCRRS